MSKLMFWRNHARSMKVNGKVADYVGGECSDVHAALAALEEKGGITIEASILDIDDSSISCVGRLEAAKKYSDKSPDYRGEIDIPRQGKFKVTAWRRQKAEGEYFLSCIVEGLATASKASILPSS